MSRYEITGRGDGHYYGVYEGETAEEAVRAMLRDAGDNGEPDIDSWHVRDIGLASIELIPIGAERSIRVPIRGPLDTIAKTRDEDLLNRCEVDIAGLPYRVGPCGGLIGWEEPAPSDSWVAIADLTNVCVREMEDAQGRLISEGGQFSDHA